MVVNELVKNEDLIIAYHEETDEYAKEDLKDELFRKNEKLPWHIANKYQNTGIAIEDLVSLANFGMLKAFNTYDPTKKILFATYAVRCMHNEILMELRNQKKHRGQESLDNALAIDSNGNELTLMDVTEDDSTNDIKRLEQRKIIQELLEIAYRKLDSRELRILQNQIADEPKTQRELSQELGISQSYISQLEKRAINKLRKVAVQKELIESYEFSGTGIFKLPNNRKKVVELPAKTPLEEAPVTTYNIDEGAGNMSIDISKISHIEGKDLKERVTYLMDTYPSLGGKDIAKLLGKNSATIYNYMSKIRKERAEEQEEAEVKELPKVEEPQVETPEPTTVIANPEPIAPALPAIHTNTVEMTVDGADKSMVRAILNVVDKAVNEGEKYKITVLVERTLSK